MRWIATNAGHEGSIVVQRVKEMKDEEGFNAQTEQYENLVQAGVIDPTKVVRSALQNAASIASLLLTTEAVISQIPEKHSTAMPRRRNGRWHVLMQATSDFRYSIRSERTRMTTPGSHPFAATSEYRSLHKYLYDRFADSVVLTFAEIEDLLGFALPDVARLEQGWWASADPDRSSIPPVAVLDAGQQDCHAEATGTSRRIPAHISLTPGLSCVLPFRAEDVARAIGYSVRRTRNLRSRPRPVPERPSDLSQRKKCQPRNSSSPSPQHEREHRHGHQNPDCSRDHHTHLISTIDASADDSAASNTTQARRDARELEGSRRVVARMRSVSESQCLIVDIAPCGRMTP